MFQLFVQLQQLIRARIQPCFIAHLRAHTNLPGALTKGNASADLLVSAALSLNPWDEACQAHALHHQNATSFHKEFKITREQA